MKKLFALVLAVAMVLSMASIAMAANTAIEPTTTHGVWGGIKEGADAELYTKTDGTGENLNGDPIPYGKTVYIPLYANEELDVQFQKADDVDGLKVTAHWDKNGEYVDSVSIVKKDGAYWVAIKTTGSSMDDNDVEGTITFTGKAYDGTKDKKVSLKKSENEYDIVLTLEYDEYKGYTKNDEYVATLTSVIPEDPAVFVFDKKTNKTENDNATADFYMEDEEFEFTCAKDPDVTFTVDTTHQSKLVLAMDTDSIDEVEDKYAAANLDFYVFNGATFKKTGELFIPADEGTYLYEIVDNTAKEVDAEYDDYDEGFYLKTKTLGAYVVSDVKLATAAATETDTTATTNPTTGAAL